MSGNRQHGWKRETTLRSIAPSPGNTLEHNILAAGLAAAEGHGAGEDLKADALFPVIGNIDRWSQLWREPNVRLHIAVIIIITTRHQRGRPGAL